MRRLAFGILVGAFIGSLVTSASFERWQRSEVVAVVLVKPDLSGFIPVDGTFLDGSWSKNQVVPMCPVKPDITGFVPTNGTSIGNSWMKSQVRAIVFVKPSLGSFEAIE